MANGAQIPPPRKRGPTVWFCREFGGGPTHQYTPCSRPKNSPSYALRSTGVPIPPTSTSNDNRPQEKSITPLTVKEQQFYLSAMVGYNLTVLLDLPIYGLADSYLVITSLFQKVGGNSPLLRKGHQDWAGGNKQHDPALAASRNTPFL